MQWEVEDFPGSWGTLLFCSYLNEGSSSRYPLYAFCEIFPLFSCSSLTLLCSVRR